MSLGAGLFATRTQIGKRIAALLGNPLRHPSRLGAVSVVALAAFAAVGLMLGIGFAHRVEAQPAPAANTHFTAAPSVVFLDTVATSSTITTDNVAILQTIDEVKSDLRSLNTALEAYRVDFDTYPDRMNVITTPIAYITGYFDDPFAAAESTEPATPPPEPTPDPGPQFLKMAYAPDWTAIRLYSVGPDGVDDRGAVEYDPTNGTLSPGDLVRQVELCDYVRFADLAQSAKYWKQRGQLNSVKSAVEAWFIKHRELPPDLQAITTDGALLPSIPTDLYSSSQPIHYRLDGGKGEAAIYSVGFDGKDDDGRTRVLGLVAPGRVPDGDIVVGVSLEELEHRYPGKNAPAPIAEDPMMKALLALKEKDGRDNAFIYYVRAAYRMPAVPDEFQRQMIETVRKEGWSKEAEPLVPYIALWQPTFDEIRKGAALDYAMGIGFDQWPATPVPNFLTIQVAAKMLVAEGKWFEAQGRYPEALDNYLTALTMGRDCSAPGVTLISELIAIAAESIALEPIYVLAKSGVLDEQSLRDLGARLAEIENTTGDIYRVFLDELEKKIAGLDKLDPKTLPPEMQFRPQELNLIKDQFQKVLDQLEAERALAYSASIRETMAKANKQFLEGAHPFVANHLPNSGEASVRALTTQCRLRICRIAVALSLFRNETSHFPAALAELAPKFIDTLPQDPFSGKDLVYVPSSEGTNYQLYGVGPSLEETQGPTPYDPTNGTVSVGAVIYEPR